MSSNPPDKPNNSLNNWKVAQQQAKEFQEQQREVRQSLEQQRQFQRISPEDDGRSAHASGA